MVKNADGDPVDRKPSFYDHFFCFVVVMFRSILHVFLSSIVEKERDDVVVEDDDQWLWRQRVDRE